MVKQSTAKLVFNLSHVFECYSMHAVLCGGLAGPQRFKSIEGVLVTSGSENAK